MKITILTIVPEMFAGLKEDILVKRACEKGLLELEIIDMMRIDVWSVSVGNNHSHRCK